MPGRANIYDENDEKVKAAQRQIQERTGIAISYDRVVNIFLACIEAAEFTESVELTIKPPAPSKKPQKRIKRTSSWVTNFPRY